MNEPSPIPPARSLTELLARRAAEAPRALAFAGAGVSVDYARLLSEAERIAAGLARQRVGRGDRVALLLPAGLDFVRGFFAVLSRAAVPCAFDPGAPPETAVRRAARIRPALALVAGPAAGGLAAAAAGAGLRCLGLDEIGSPGRRPPAEAPEPADLAFLQPTSGTSGEPRFARITHAAALASLAAARELLAVGPADVLVSWVPPWHDLGLLRFVLGAVAFGTPCHLVPPAIRTLPQWLETIAGVGGTVTGAPDFAYRLATRLVPPDGLDLSSLRFATNGGEPVRRSTISAFEERFGVPGAVRPGYGLAEATLGVTCLRAGEALRVDERGNVSCGRPFPGVEVRIDAPAGESAGEILVRSPAVFAGYLDAPRATAEALRGGWLHTGDVGRLDDEGHLFVLGRERTLLKRGGAPLAPRELEEAAAAVPGVRSAAAVALPAGERSASEEIVLAVEHDPSSREDAERVAGEVSAAVRAALGFAPERIVVLAPRAMPRTDNGKTRYAELRAALASGELERRGAVLFSGAGPPA